MKAWAKKNGGFTMYEKALHSFLEKNVFLRGFKILAMTSNKTSGIFSYKGVKKYFYTKYENDFKKVSIIIENYWNIAHALISAKSTKNKKQRRLKNYG